MTCDFTSFLTIFQSYQDNEKMCANGSPFTVEKISSRAGLEPGTTRSETNRSFVMQLHTIIPVHHDNVVIG